MMPPRELTRKLQSHIMSCCPNTLVIWLLDRAARGDAVVDVLDRAVESIYVGVAIRPDLAIREHGTSLHHREEMLAVGGTILLAQHFREALQAGHRLGHAGRGAGKIALARE